VYYCGALAEHSTRREDSVSQIKSHNSRQVTIRDIAATSATGSVPLVVARSASGRILRPRRHETTWTREGVPARREGACLVCSEFKPRAFLRLTDSTPAEAAARWATSALETAAGDAPAQGDAWRPFLRKSADGSNAAALAAAPDAGDSTVRPVVDDDSAASRPFTAATPGIAGAAPDPGDAVAPAHAEAAHAGDAAAPGALPAAAAAVASVAAEAAAGVPNIESAFVVKRGARRDYAALALRSLALDSSRVCRAGFI